VASVECAAVLFDLDGVLVDSTAAVERHWRLFADRAGIDAATVIAAAHGRRSRDTIAQFITGDIDRYTQWYEQLEVEDCDGILAVPGAVDLLAALPADRWCIVTSCDRALAHARLAAAHVPLPQLMVTADDVTRGKPDPAGYLSAMQAMGVAATRTVVMEDAPSGIAAGRSAGAHVVGVATTHRPNDLHADTVVADLRNVDVEVRGTSLHLTLNQPGELIKGRPA
jgi:mannitol-1-/sugar-/sorbitol-6-phosphatase